METRRSSGCRTGGFHHRWSRSLPALPLVTAPLLAAVLIATVLLGTTLVSAGQTGSPAATASQYENDASPAALYAQGDAAGSAGAQGMVILDFGRPAAETTLGTITQDDTFASFPSIAAAVE